MSEEQESQMATADSGTAVDKFIEHMEGAMKNTLNFRFDEAQFHLDQMQTLVHSILEPDKLPADGFIKLVGEFVMGNQQLAVAETEQDRQAALTHLKASKNAARNMRIEHSDLANNPGLFQMALGIDAQVLAIQTRIAQERGDAKEVERLSAQSESVFNEIVESLGPDMPMRYFLEGIKSMKEAVPKFVMGVSAAADMNLDLAQQYLRESSEAFAAMNEHFQKAENEIAMVQSSTRVGDGFRLLARALDFYVSTLRAAIIGDVSKPDVERLAEAERGALDGAALIAKGVSAAPGFFGGMNLQPYADVLSKLARNLRGLCARSLSPKEISRSASPRALIYFLGTFTVLAVALPLTGLLQKLYFAEVIVLLVISLIISLIAAFGFESIRLIPWFDVFARFVPSSRDSAKEKPSARNSQSTPQSDQRG